MVLPRSTWQVKFKQGCNVLKLPNVTLIVISSINIDKAIFALRYSMLGIEFGFSKIVTHEKLDNLPSNITYEQSPKINSIDEYSKYVIYDLTRHITTDYCLLIQHDGFVLHPEAWSNEFLNWDYIGAPWAVSNVSYVTKKGEHVRVGNGGFSLRSKKLLDIPNKHNMPFLEEQGFYNEDGNISVYNRDFLLNLGIKYAPIEVAARFSREIILPEYKDIITFGFHGMGNFKV